MKFIAPKRPIYLINGKRVRDLKIEMNGHPKIPIEDYLFKTHRPVVLTATRYNGLLMTPEFMRIYKRKSGRDVIELRFPKPPAQSHPKTPLLL